MKIFAHLSFSMNCNYRICILVSTPSHPHTPSHVTHSYTGHRILEEILGPLLSDLSSPAKAEVALDGLKQVMAVKSSVVLPHIVPQLVTPPVNTKALALLSSVAGEITL